MTEEERQAYNAQKAKSKAEQLASMTEEERQAYNAQKAKSKAEERASMTKEERQAYNAQKAKSKAEQLASMMEEERQAYNAQKAKSKAEKVAAMTEEDRKANNAREAGYKSKERASMTEEERQAYNAQKAKSKAKKLAAMTEEERQAHNVEKATSTQAKRDQQKEDEMKNHATFGTERINDETSFRDFEQYPETAALLYHSNSGHNKFWAAEDINELLSDDKTMEDEKVQQLLSILELEIKDEKLEYKELVSLLEQYRWNQGRAVGDKENPKWNVLKGLKKSVDAHHLTCGACGIKEVNGRYGEYCSVVALADLPKPLILTEEQDTAYQTAKDKPDLLLPVNEEATKKAKFPMWKLMSVHESDLLKRKFHLHTEFVHKAKNDHGAEEELTVLCHRCTAWLATYNKSAKKGARKKGGKKATKNPRKKVPYPPNSIAAGIDFGDARRLRDLEVPSMMELAMIARHRHFHNVIKVYNNHGVGCRSDGTHSQIRGHSILFRHDSPVVACLALMYEELHRCRNSSNVDTEGSGMKEKMKKFVTLELVGPKGEMDRIGRKAKLQTHLRARAHVVYQWLAVLQQTHPLYKNDPKLELSDFAQCKRVVHEWNEAIMESAVQVTDKGALNADIIMGDDVAQVRSRILNSADVEELNTKNSGSNDSTDDDEACRNDLKVSYSYVSNSGNTVDGALHGSAGKEGNAGETMEEIINDIAAAFNVQMPIGEGEEGGDEEGANREQQGFRSRREEEPLSEFDDMQELLTGAFPQVFMLGKTYDQSSLLKPDQMEHLLMQYTNAAATCRELLFYLFDCKNRHNVIHNFASKVRKDPHAFAEYARLVRNEEFQKKIILAKQDPTSAVAKEVLRTVLPVLSFGTRASIAGALGDTTSLSRAMAMAKRYGPASTMLTITPDDINCPTSFRLACTSLNNEDFPANADENFFKKLEESGTFIGENKVDIPLSYNQRMKAAVENPVAVASEFRAMLENVLQILVGCPLDYQPGTNSTKVRSWYFKSKASNSPHHKGVFGHVTAFFGCVETQGRGALHFHVIIYGGITPTLLENAAAVPEICSKIEKILDDMYCAELPKGYHVRDYVVKQMKTTPEGRKLLPSKVKAYPSMKRCPFPCPRIPVTQTEWKRFCWENVLRTGIHEHTFTCRKPPQGKDHCRNAMPAGTSKKTGPKELIADPRELEEKGLKHTMPREADIVRPLPGKKKRDYHKNPVQPRSDRMVVWELKRPLLEKLPPLKENHRTAYEAAKSGNGNALSGDLPIDLAEAKKNCIKNIEDCVVKDGSLIENDFMPIQEWLNGFECVAVIALYENLNSQIEERNGYVTVTNPTIHNATCSSTNAILLGSAQQSTCALFYVVPYVCKNKVALEACIVALESAQKHVQAYPSKDSDDKGNVTDARYVQHMFTHVLNDLSRSMEVSDTQVALSLLNMGTEVCSDSFRYFGADYSVNYFVHQLEEMKKGSQSSQAESTTTMAPDRSDAIKTTDESLSEEEYGSSEGVPCYVDNVDPKESVAHVVAESRSSRRGRQSFGPAALYKTLGDECKPVHYPAHWWYRGIELQNLTQFEYYALVEVKILASIQSSNTDEEEEEVKDYDIGNGAESTMDDTSNTPAKDEGRVPPPHKGGRPKRKHFLFHHNHPLYATHCQVLRAKQPTLIFNAFPPPYPGPMPEPPSSAENNVTFLRQEYEDEYRAWTKSAAAFVSFYGVCFLPHPKLYGSNDPAHIETIFPKHGHTKSIDDPLSWEWFCHHIKSMENSTHAIDRLRLESMLTFIRGFHTDHKKLALMNNFRHRKTTIWSDLEKKEAADMFSSMHRGNMQHPDGFMEGEDPSSAEAMASKLFDTAKQKSVRGEQSFSAKQVFFLESVFSSASAGAHLAGHNSSSNDSSFPTRPDEILHLRSQQAAVDVQNLAHEMKQGSLDVPAEKERMDSDPEFFPDQEDHSERIKLLQARAAKYVDNRNLSPSQKRLVRRMHKYFDSVRECMHKFPRDKLFQGLYRQENLLPPQLFVPGDPGAGKSYASDTLCELPAILEIGDIATCSYNGMAAVNVDGSTICSMFKIHDKGDGAPQGKHLDHDTILLLRRKLNIERLCCIIVDEISTIDTRIIALLNYRLQQIMDNDLPFGGLPVLFVGDFKQLGPVRKTFIPKDIMIWAGRIYKENLAGSGAAPSTRAKSGCKPTKCGKSSMGKRFAAGAANRGAKHKRKKEIEADEAASVRFQPGRLAYEGCTLFLASNGSILRSRCDPAILTTMFLCRNLPTERQSMLTTYCNIKNLQPLM